jgi:YNFM family putative membrane transporter
MLGGIALMVTANLVVVIAGLVVLTAGFFAAHSVASGWVGLRANTFGIQGPSVYLLCYYLGSAVGGTLGAYALHGGAWNGIGIYTGAFTSRSSAWPPHCEDPPRHAPRPDHRAHPTATHE